MTQALNKGGGATVAGARVTLTHANHSSSHEGAYAGESCGYVVEIPGEPRLYFAGDTNVFGDMALIGRIYAPDVAIIPIGDHFTMGPREAAVAAELIGAPRVVPSHYGTFPLLTGTPDALRDLLPGGIELLEPDAGGDGAVVTTRERWFGATGRRVPEMALEGTLDTSGALELDGIDDAPALRDAHARGIPVVVRAATADEVARRSHGPRCRACSLPTRRSSAWISRISPMASRRDRHVLDLRLRSRGRPVGGRDAVEVPRGRLGRAVGGTARGRDRDAVVRESAVRPGRARAPRAGCRPTRSWSS